MTTSSSGFRPRATTRQPPCSGPSTTGRLCPLARRSSPFASSATGRCTVPRRSAASRGSAARRVGWQPWGTVAKATVPTGSGEMPRRGESFTTPDVVRRDGRWVHEGEFAGAGGRRGRHSDDFLPLWDEMTKLHRDHPGARW